MGPMAIVVDLQLGRSLAAVCPHDAVVELLDETRRGVGDQASDLAHLPAIQLPAHVDSAIDQAAIEYCRLWCDLEALGH